jgi:hypothetical protein
MRARGAIDGPRLVTAFALRVERGQRSGRENEPCSGVDRRRRGIVSARQDANGQAGCDGSSKRSRREQDGLRQKSALHYFAYRVMTNF